MLTQMRRTLMLSSTSEMYALSAGWRAACVYVSKTRSLWNSVAGYALRRNRRWCVAALRASSTKSASSLRL